jgi:hypothetical protein
VPLAIGQTKMTSKKKTQQAVKNRRDEEQHARFVEAAKKAEADQAADALDKAFGKLTVRKSGTIRKSRGT